MRHALLAALVLAPACGDDSFDDDVPDVPQGTVDLVVAYDATADAPLLAWSTSEVRGCRIGERDVETSAVDVPVAAPETSGFVEVTLTCNDAAGKPVSDAVRLWWGPDEALVLGGGDGVTLVELLPLDLVHGGLTIAGTLPSPPENAGLFDVTRDLKLIDGGGQADLLFPLPLRDVYGDLVIEDDALTSLSEYQPNRYRGGLVLRDAGGLTDLTTFPKNVASLPGDLAILENPNLVSLAGLERLERLGGDLQVIGNDLLERLADADDLGLSKLDEVGGSVVVQGNPALRALWSRGSQLATLGGSVSVVANPVLIEAKGLAGLGTIPGDLVLRDDDALSVLPSLFVTEIGGDLVLRGNAALAEVGALGVLTRVGGDVVIEEDDALVDLDFLAALEAIGGSLSVVDDATLADVAGLEGLATVDGDATFSGNPLLCPDEIDALLAGIDVAGLATQVMNGEDAVCP